MRENAQGIEITENFNEPHIKLSFSFSKYDAFSSVNDLLIRAGTKTVEVQENKGNAVISVKKQMRPKEESMKIIDAGIVYMPMWHVESTNGIMEIDGVTGEILSERKYKLDSSMLGTK
jgi:hypothetical protein